MSKRRSNSTDAIVKFLEERVASNQGISLDKLAGYMSQLPSALRSKYGCSLKSVKMLVQQFPTVFDIRNQRNVYLRANNTQATSPLDGSGERFVTPSPDRVRNEEDITSITDVTGTVYRLFSFYGFISIEHPIKATVYFDVHTFDNAKHTSIPSSGLQVGDCVILDAKLGPKDCEARFRATRVTLTSMTNISASPGLSLRSVNCAERADGDALTHLVNQHGVIQSVKSNYGFIKFGHNLRERAFFHANAVDESLGTWLNNLPDLFTAEDKVRFNAKPSKKPSDRVKWEATTVYLYRCNDCAGGADTEDEHGSEFFWSDEESYILDLFLGKLDKSREADIIDSSECCAGSYTMSGKANTCKFSNIEKRDARLSLEWERRQELSDERGFFYPETASVGTIRFGPGSGLEACAAAEVTYHNNQVVDNLLWEVADGQEVNFDAVQADNNTWIATLAWIGERPAKPPVGDSKVVFTRIADKRRGTQKPSPNAEPTPHDHFSSDKILQNVVPDSKPIDPFVSIHKGVKGIIVQVMECTGTCEVREFPASRQIEFTNEIFYKDGTMFMDDLTKVLREGDTVFLDYKVVVSGTTEEILCYLVWNGRRPIGVRQKNPKEFGQTLQISMQADNTLCFEALQEEVETADEASRDSSRVLLDTGLQKETVSISENEASSGMSMAGVLAAPPATSSAPIPMRSPRTHHESYTWENVPEVLFLPAGANDDVHLRLAEMVEAEIIEEKERLRVVLRDIGVQTVSEESFPPTSSKPDCLLLPLVSSSSQTLSTGEIKSKELFIN